MSQDTQEFGARLRRTREQSGVTLRQIADATKLSIHSLGALERGRIEVLPGGIYRRAIVRAYAREVGLDPEGAVRDFLAQYPDDLPPPPDAGARAPELQVADIPQPAARHWRRSAKAALALVGALVPLVAGVFYFATTRVAKR